MREVFRPKLEEAAIQEAQKLGYTKRDCSKGCSRSMPRLAVNGIEVSTIT